MAAVAIAPAGALPRISPCGPLQPITIIRHVRGIQPRARAFSMLIVLTICAGVPSRDGSFANRAFFSCLEASDNRTINRVGVKGTPADERGRVSSERLRDRRAGARLT